MLSSTAAALVAAAPSPEPTTSTTENVLTLAGNWVLGVTVILGFGLALWMIGRLIIRGIVRGIKKGVELDPEDAKELLARVRVAHLEGAEPSEEDELQHRLERERRQRRGNTIGQVLRAGLNALVLITTVLLLLQYFGIGVAPLLASAGVAGVALGFGAQSLVKDILSGLFMLIEDQYGVGDVVDVGQANGLVEEFGLRSTRLRSLDGTVWYVPNGEITRVGNMTQLWSRAKIEARFAFDTDIAAARQAMLDAVDAAKAANADVADAILGDSEVAGIEAFDYNSVTLRLLIQVKPLTQWTVMRAVREQMRDLFMERGIRLTAPEAALLQDRASVSPTRGSASRGDAEAKANTASSKPRGTGSSSSGRKPGAASAARKGDSDRVRELPPEDDE